MARAGAARLPLVERLRPTRLDELVGNPRARAELRAWADAWNGDRIPSQRAAVLSGPAGVGKTSAALAIASEYGWTLVEMNASDARNEAAVEQVAGRASITHTLDAPTRPGVRRRALILLDEADSLAGRLTDAPRARPEPPTLREYLRGRYRSIEALNSAYGLRPGAKPVPFAEWDEVPRTPGNSAWARLPAARRDIDDWRSIGRGSDLSDRGGVAAIGRIIRSTRQPIVLTANDERELSRYSAAFRSGVRRIHFYPIAEGDLRRRLEEIVRQERMTPAPGAIEAIVRRSRGDLRAALNDLEAVSALPPEVIQLSVLGARDLAADLEALTQEVLTTPRFYRSTEIRDRLDAPPDDLLPWIEENLPHFAPDAAHRDEGFVALAAASHLLDRARRARVWSLWSYGSEVMTGGVALALRERPAPRSSGVAFPQFLGEMGRSRSRRALRDGLAGKTGARFHLSRRKSRESVLPLLEALFGAARGRHVPSPLRAVAAQVARELALSPEEVGFLLGVEPDSEEVNELLIVDGPEQGSEPDATAPSPPDSPSGRRGQRHLTDFGG
jgi:DNA polymerase III delta prime subunit